MREIKFRAWDKEKKIMVHGLTINEDIIHVLNDNQLHPISEIENLEWLQYTGLKDKNGKEIYEGDILRITTTFHTYNVRVIWDQDCWSFDDTGEYGTLSEWNGGAEVVGNVFENPELLEEKA